MKKKIIRLTESDLHNIIKNSVKRIIDESILRQEDIMDAIYDVYPNINKHYGSILSVDEYMDVVQKILEKYPSLNSDDIQTILSNKFHINIE